MTILSMTGVGAAARIEDAAVAKLNIGAHIPWRHDRGQALSALPQGLGTNLTWKRVYCRVKAELAAAAA